VPALISMLHKFSTAVKMLSVKVHAVRHGCLGSHLAPMRVQGFVDAQRLQRSQRCKSAAVQMLLINQLDGELLKRRT